MLNNIVEEPLRAFPETLDRHAFSDEMASARNHVLTLIRRHLTEFGDKFPAEAAVDGRYPLTENVEWTTSFWTGQLWLAWEMSGDAVFRELAEKHVRSFGARIAGRHDTNTHDLGFLYTLSCVAAWRLTGNRDARGFSLLAAEALLERFHVRAKIIQAWGDLKDPAQAGRMIIDCTMNLPLLYWATEQTGDPRFADAAKAHVQQSATYLIRPDASTYHTYYMDVETGAPRYGNTQQGYADDSCWSRGQAWGIYGFLLSYIYTGDRDMIALSKRLANYFLNRLPEDYVCHWDLALLGTDALRDSSSAAIAVCGLLELVKHLPVTDPDRARYQQWAEGIMSSLTKHYLAGSDEACNGLLKHSVYHLASNKGVDECSSWGDYFYVEALMRVTQSWKLYW
ncbi:MULTISPECIES: glycoside hydrolase family 88 protein [unclassified Enterobacter]|jgi:unsaturated chondroitin disaccharide hydrolase|uniref:glycoside hydrolase family 88 protein n=1 Tax=unclassified Enterobacter TaxID=2608935 RepID=UPI00296F2153|nr:MULTISPECIES: glycoside hydrolase family 88 protein [unclassified Enterobacter]WJD49730.1 glycoside hydrolase family 88 protein [Enterobacter sp. PGRG2]